MAKIDTSINGSPIVTITVTLAVTIPADPAARSNLYTATATPVSDPRVGVAPDEHGAVCLCVQAIIDADEVPE